MASMTIFAFTIAILLLDTLISVQGQFGQGPSDQCGCAKMLYKKQREERRIKLLNECLAKHADGKLFSPVPIIRKNDNCIRASLQGYVNLQTFARHMQRLPDKERLATDACYYDALGYRNGDGSANAEKMVEDLEAGVREDPGIISDNLLSRLLKNAKQDCDRADMKKYYKCVYQACFGALPYPDI